jgi:hypothetical protein
VATDGHELLRISHENESNVLKEVVRGWETKAVAQLEQYVLKVVCG